ncbi:MAG: RagB/SusD family nutrient uptake outer membrane protein [Cyclobacteriaceae bacterium]
MKKLIYFTTLVASLTMVSTSCIEPDQEIFDNIPRDVVLSSTDPDVLASLAKSAYAPLRGTWGTHNSLWSMHEVASDEMVITQKGPDWEDGGQWIRMHRHEYTANEQSINNAWEYLFGGIAQINILLTQFSESEALSAELRTLRGLVYLWLIDAYGNVPIILETDDDSAPPTKSRQEIFNFIETEVTQSLPLLEKGRTYTRVNYYVGQMILAKLYLNAEVYTGTARWQDAADALEEVIGGPYSLEADFFANFVTNNAGSSENIFVINYDSDNAQGFNLAQMTLHYLNQNTYNLQEQPWNGYSSLEEFYNSFDENDVRINSFIEGPQFDAQGNRLLDISAEPGDPDGEPLTFTPEINELAPNAYRQAGVRVGKWEFAMGAPQHLSNDYPVFRLSDALLMYAEAQFRLGDGATAADYVNQVRARAGIDPVSSVDADLLLAERGRELFAEGWRRSDLIRFGKYNDPWWEKPASPQFRNLFPIPQTQGDQNQNLVQNPGYPSF